ncbi:alkylated DNA repair protein alkB homolog 8 [Clupea harengus]|uniref:tRNA (carboxymethyluridine(34)-5-O)-methyltransferase n=1 Tax=Clupea harengus TaxID=7950 RepID=A0A6P3WA00_CLUHA|nr:alkylated DNA repair protein alkB homolog 8 [Clupea harengus]
MDSRAENVKAVRKTKEEKKLLRKQIKASHTLLKHEGINTVSQPTEYLVVANGGLGNGVCRVQLQEVLDGAATVVSLLMPPNKPYAFVTYTSSDDAQQAHTLLNGQQLQCQGQMVTLYFSYVERIGCEQRESADLPPGLVVLEDYVSQEEEARLLQAVDWAEHDNVTVHKALKHRRVKHYGYEFRYDNNNVDKDKPLPIGIPAVCDPVLQRCLKDGHISIFPDQLTVNQYESGQGIPPHIDTHSAFEDPILSLSLGAKTVMGFRHPDGRSVAVVLPERSLLVMRGESRFLWTHGITPRKFDMVPAHGSEGSVVTSDPSNLTLNRRGTRTSFTFRRLRHAPCVCPYPSVCDSQSPPAAPAPDAPSLPRDDGDASRLEAQFVHQVYEEIASHFSSTRHSPWPRVRDFLLALPAGGLLADVGCGNGKYLGINPEVMSVGCDRSASLVQICIERGFQAFVSDALDVPLRGATCDACISIAVIHHFSTQERRLAAVTELVRLLKPGGRALIYVWAMEQEYNKQKSKYLKDSGDKENTQPVVGEGGHSVKQSPLPDVAEEKGSTESTPKLSVHTNRTAFNSPDLLVPWHLKGEEKNTCKHGGGSSADAKATPAPAPAPVFHRYYHVFQKGELERLCSLVKDVEIRTSYHDQGNWCVVLEKVPK